MAKKKSGKYWVTWAKNSAKVDDLEVAFKPKSKSLY